MTEKKKKPSTNHKTPLLSQHSALKVWVFSSRLSLGEKNEIQLKSVFMENRLCVQCWLSQGRVALCSPWLG